LSARLGVDGRPAGAASSHRSLGRPSYKAAKRIIDLALAAAALLAVMPVLAAACMAILAESPGSPLYLQWRAGRGGRPFRIVKLRTMVRGADKLGPALTVDCDPRITRVGSVLRRWSIDELPQLLNVLAGQMSLVGPRPELVAIAAGYTPRERLVLGVRPGITGWAQVNGRDDLSIPEKLGLELDYCGRRGLRLDLTILARTVGVVAGGRGAKH